MNKLLTYIILLIVAAGCSNINEPKTIAIQTLSGFASDLKDTIKQSINYYHFEKVVYSDIKIPKEYYTDFKSPKYKADSIIRDLRKKKQILLTIL